MTWKRDIQSVERLTRTKHWAENHGGPLGHVGAGRVAETLPLSLLKFELNNILGE
jgi:hypothetical protein